MASPLQGRALSPHMLQQHLLADCFLHLACLPACLPEHRHTPSRHADLPASTHPTRTNVPSVRHDSVLGAASRLQHASMSANICNLVLLMDVHVDVHVGLSRSAVLHDWMKSRKAHCQKKSCPKTFAIMQVANAIFI